MPALVNQSVRSGIRSLSGFVQGYVENIFDCYASETTTETTMGIETSSRTSEEYFLMPLLVDDHTRYCERRDYDQSGYKADIWGVKIAVDHKFIWNKMVYYITIVTIIFQKDKDDENDLSQLPE